MSEWVRFVVCFVIAILAIGLLDVAKRWWRRYR